MTIGSQIVISDKMLSLGIQEKVSAKISQQLGAAFAQKLLVDGAERVTNTENAWERDDGLRTQTLCVIAEEDFSDPSLRFLLARAADQNMALTGRLLAINMMPLWKIIWHRMRGRPLVQHG